MSTEMKQVNVCRFLAEALSEQLGTFTEDCDCEPELIEGVVEISQLDFDSLLEHLNENGFEENSDSIEAIDNFKQATEGEAEVLAYWEA